jgi:hypothetical protein
MTTESPFKRICASIYSEDDKYVRVSPRLKMILPTVQYYFTDNQIIPSNAEVIVLPGGGWAEAYNGSPFDTMRPLGHIVTPQFLEIPTSMPPKLIRSKSVFPKYVVDLTNDSE